MKMRGMFFASCLISDRYNLECCVCVHVPLCARTKLSHSIINAALFLFACFGATGSSLEDAFLMIRERRDVPWFFSSNLTMDGGANRRPTADPPNSQLPCEHQPALLLQRAAAQNRLSRHHALSVC